MNHNTLTVPRTAHIYTHGNSDKASQLWIVCHGYRQTAEDFIKPFKVLPEEHFVVSVEGHSRFYTDSDYKNVVASWMTKRFREDEIKDQYELLNRVFENYSSGFDKIHFLGFSQGVATVFRYIINQMPQINSLLLWAGWPPEDVQFTETKTNYLKEVNSFYVIGEDDPYFNEERLREFNNRKDLEHLDLDIVTFSGGHRLSRKVLLRLAEMIM